jgi:hypothetical protein
MKQVQRVQRLHLPAQPCGVVLPGVRVRSAAQETGDEDEAALLPAVADTAHCGVWRLTAVDVVCVSACIVPPHRASQLNQAATQHKNPNGMTQIPDLLGQSTYQLILVAQEDFVSSD